MTAPSNANTSGPAPTDALRLNEPQRTAIEHAAMDANAYVWPHCRLAMVADGEIVGYPCFSRADMAELARLYEAAPASPLLGGGWKPSRNDVARRCDPKAWEFYDRHIENPIMGAECRAEVAASIRMADAILALPAAPTGDA